MKLRTFLVGLWVICFTAPGAAQDLSQTAGAFADIGYGARAAGLGEAYTGVAQGASSIQWNPAGLAHQSGYEVALSYINLLGLVNYQHLTAVVPLSAQRSGLGVSLQTSGDKALRESAVRLGYAHRLGPVTLGGTVVMRHATFGNNTLQAEDYLIFEEDEVQEAFANQVYGTAMGFGVDLGVLYRPLPNAQFGLMLRDIYAPLFWESQNDNPNNAPRGTYTETVPFRPVVGSRYRINNVFTVATDYRPALQSQRPHKIKVGAEADLMNRLFIRTGLQQFINGRSDEKYSLGAGLNVPITGDLQLQADYAYQIEKLANTQYFSFVVSF